jgi:hypothetical protein
VIDIVRDYLALGMGSAQAVTEEVAGAGRAGATRVASALNLGPLPSLREGADLGDALERGRALLSSPGSVDLDAVASRLGLAKKSELNAVRQQIQRLERRLGEARRER